MCTFLQRLETNQRALKQAKNENQDLVLENAQLIHENDALKEQIRSETNKSLLLQSENETLQTLNLEQQQIVDNAQCDNDGNNICRTPLFRQSHDSNGGLGAELEQLGYFDASERSQAHSSEMIQTETKSSETNTLCTKQFLRESVDAQEEFYRLTVIAAKIKFNDIPISTSTLWDKVKEAQLKFHEVADWLNAYLYAERHKIAQVQDIANRQRIKSITESGPSSPGKDFFRKIKDLADSVTPFVTMLRLEVRFGRRVFEVKMKKSDKLETLIQTLPRIIGEDANVMQIFIGDQQLDASKTLIELGINNNDVLRMLHQKKVASYLRRYEMKEAEKEMKNGIEMTTHPNSESFG